MKFLSGRVIVGLVIIIIGAVLFIDRLGWDVDVGKVLSYWPVILVIIGLKWLVSPFITAKEEEKQKFFFSWTRFVSAVILLIVGVLYLGRNTGFIDPGYIEIFWSILFPAILILIGISLIRGKVAQGGKNRIAMMGGIEAGKSPWKLESNSYLAIMGGIELDLTTAEIPEGETIIDLTAVMGGITVEIPSDLPVIYDGTAVLGGVTFLNEEAGGIIASRKVEHNVDYNKPLVRIQSRAIMGGVEVKEKKKKYKKQESI